VITTRVLELEPSLALDPADAVPRIGLVLLSTDATTEPDFARLLDRGDVLVASNRITFENPTTRESLLRTGPLLEAAASDLLPGSRFAAIYFSCTAATAVLGADGVAAAVARAKPEAVTVTPITAASAALRTLGAERISLLAPYTAPVTEGVAESFRSLGFAIDRVSCWNLEDDRDMGRVRPETIIDAAAGALDPASDALFISCTALRSSETVPALEAALGRPVVTSNHAAAWACRELAGCGGEHPEGGRLFAHRLDQSLL
jgi:maleate isomerase